MPSEDKPPPEYKPLKFEPGAPPTHTSLRSRKLQKVWLLNFYHMLVVNYRPKSDLMPIFGNATSRDANFPIGGIVHFDVNKQ